MEVSNIGKLILYLPHFPPALQKLKIENDFLNVKP